MLHRGYGQSKKNDTITIITITGVLRKEMSTLYVPVFIRRAVINCRAVMSSTVSCRRCHLFCCCTCDTSSVQTNDNIST